MSESLCPNCQRPGPHFVPPSFGEEGFYLCEPSSPPKLTLVPCNHFWLEVRTIGQQVTALCKFRPCQKKHVFTMEEWGKLAQEGRCLNKPVRV